MMDNTTRTAFERLLKIAQSDTGQSGRVASFVLAWWNAADPGGFDIADLFAVDAEIGRDMATVFSYLVGRPTASIPRRIASRSRRSCADAARGLGALRRVGVTSWRPTVEPVARSHRASDGHRNAVFQARAQPI